MDLVKSLFDSGVLGGLATIFITFLGQLVALNTKKFTDVLEALTKAQAGDVAAHNAAFKRTANGGEWVRRAMLFGAFFVLGLCPFILAFFANIPVAVEVAEQSGGWLWGLIPEKETLRIMYVNGFYIAEVWKELMANLISAYIGAGITRKAFQLGR